MVKYTSLVFQVSCPRFVKDVANILSTMEASFLKLAECQHMLETNGKTPEWLS